MLATLEGEAELDEVLASGPVVRAVPVVCAQEGDPTRAFLKAITVEGFRGIGPAASLTLNPASGLVVVSGRNGPGKSSFAEALELALTGQSYRGAKHLALWRAQWRKHGLGRSGAGLASSWSLKVPVAQASVWSGRRTPS